MMSAYRAALPTPRGDPEPRFWEARRRMRLSPGRNSRRGVQEGEGCDSRDRSKSEIPDGVLTMQPCKLCGRPSRLLNSEHCGYQRPERYAIYECVYCDLQFAEPLHSLNGIYEHIYRSSAILPGYARYHRYAHSIARESDPLSWLAQQECVY